MKNDLLDLLSGMLVCVAWALFAVIIFAFLNEAWGQEASYGCMNQYLDCAQKHIYLDLAYNDCVRVLNGATKDHYGMLAAEQLTSSQRIRRRNITPFMPHSEKDCQAYALACDRSFYGRLSQLRACRKTIAQVEALPSYIERGAKLGAYLMTQTRNNGVY